LTVNELRKEEGTRNKINEETSNRCTSKWIAVVLRKTGGDCG
jgi:hypothetical protein